MKRNPFLILASLFLAGGIAAFFLFDRKIRSEAGLSEHADRHGDHESHDEHGRHGMGRIRLEAGAMEQSGISIDTAKPRRMALNLSLQGRVVPNEERQAHVHPRFPGLIREVRKQLGEPVRKGDVLAIVESNESMQPYSVTSQIDGTVVRKHATIGETASGEEELFTVADLSTVWVDFQVYRQDFPRLKTGQRVRIFADGVPFAETSLTYLAPVSEEHTQTLLVRAVLANRNGAWPPGLFVQGDVAVESFAAPSAVRLEGVQTLEGKPVVFVREGGEFEAREVQLGRRDGDWVEIVSGLENGEAYASRNSFVLKADLGKGEAEHEH